jgi:hypothetical protein
MKTKLLKKIREKYTLKYKGGIWFAFGRKKLKVISHSDLSEFMFDLLIGTLGFWSTLFICVRNDRKKNF